MTLLNVKGLNFFGTSKTDKARDAIVLIKLTNKLGILRKKFCVEARAKLRNNALDLAFAEYFQWIFVFLPFEYVVRVVDCYLIEGDKFLFRIALALALLYEQKTNTAITLEKMKSFCESISNHCTPSQLISKVKSFRLNSLLINSHFDRH